MIISGKNIYFISPSIPRANSTSSDIIFYRHLEKLHKKGNNIILITLEDSLRIKTPPEKWTVISLPNRKWWFPPFRNNKILKLIRYWIYFIYLSKGVLKEKKPDLLLGYLWGTTLSGFDAFVSRRLNVPLCLFYHDDQKLFNSVKNNSQIFEHEHYVVKTAKIVFTVSDKLIFSPSEFKNKHILLPPIPEGYQSTTKAHCLNKKLIYSGLIQKSHIAVFNQIAKTISNSGWELEVITSENLLGLIRATGEKNYTYRPFFEKTPEAIKYITENASALLVGYPVSNSTQDQSWLLKSFPSKFTEYIHLGIPIIAIAPENSAFGEWCQRHNWPLYSNNTEDIGSMIEKLNDNQYWKEQSNLCIEIGNNFFSPEKIQEAFEAGIESVLK